MDLLAEGVGSGLAKQIQAVSSVLCKTSRRKKPRKMSVSWENCKTRSGYRIPIWESNHHFSRANDGTGEGVTGGDGRQPSPLGALWASANGRSASNRRSASFACNVGARGKFCAKSHRESQVFLGAMSASPQMFPSGHFEAVLIA
jgi:hypothetical protein